jgi:exosortase A-associated hydrolase 2
MSEIPFFFPNNSHQLFGVLHRPENPNGRGFVFCHPFAEEKLWTHRVYVSYARSLCASGYAVLRFDYMGHGDSSGRFEDSTIDSRLADILCAVGALETQVGPLDAIGLLGLRFGATLAALAAEKVPDIHPLILWEPIDNGAQYMKELIRINLSTQSTVYKKIYYNTEALIAKLKEGGRINIDGYDIHYSLYEQMSSIQLSGRQWAYANKVFIVQINKNKNQGIERIEKLALSYKQPICLAVVEKPFWKEIKEYYAHAENLFESTTQWLTNNA